MAVTYAPGRARVIAPVLVDEVLVVRAQARPVWRDLVWVAVRMPMWLLPPLLLIGVRYGGPHWWV